MYLVYVDRLLGWPIVRDRAGDATSRHLISALRDTFSSTGVPSVLRYDGGPQFASRRTRNFLSRWGVTHVMSSPHYPQSNGHAEAAVKSVKRLIEKTTERGDLDTTAANTRRRATGGQKNNRLASGNFATCLLRLCDGLQVCRRVIADNP